MRSIRATLAVLVVTAATVLGGATAASAAEGVRATDAPTKIRVGAPYMEFPITVTTWGAAESMSVDLVNLRHGYVTSDYADGPVAGRPGVFKLRVDMYDWQVESWGAHRWELDGYRVDPWDGFIDISSTVAVDMRAHSMLGLSTSRSGSTVAVKGSLRAYHNGESRYVAWSGRPVSVQRWTGSAWVQLAGARTNAQGDINLRVQAPKGAPIRLVAGDTASTWGAVSATVNR